VRFISTVKSNVSFQIQADSFEILENTLVFVGCHVNMYAFQKG